MNWKEFIYRFEFQNDATFDEQIDSIAGVQCYIAVTNRQRFFNFDGHIILGQFVSQTNSIRSFEQTRTQFLVNPDCATDNLSRKIVTIFSVFSVCSVVQGFVTRLVSGLPR